MENEKTELSLMPLTFGHKYQMAQILCKSAMLPPHLKTPENVVVTLQYGHELGLSPMVAINNIYMVNGKPTLSADIMHAICRRSSEYGGVKWIEISDKVAKCVVTRKTASYSEETIGFYTIDMAKDAGLLTKDNWKKYPARMLKHRALSYALRDAFPDLISGFYTREELEKNPIQVERNITAEATASTVDEKPLAQQALEQTEQTVLFDDNEEMTNELA